jgi:hypothetical protein
LGPTLVFRALKVRLGESRAHWRASGANAPGLYCTLIRRHPGYMSAPHYYSTDRYCMVRQA